VHHCQSYALFRSRIIRSIGAHSAHRSRSSLSTFGVIPFQRYPNKLSPDQWIDIEFTTSLYIFLPHASSDPFCLLHGARYITLTLQGRDAQEQSVLQTILLLTTHFQDIEMRFIFNVVTFFTLTMVLTFTKAHKPGTLCDVYLDPVSNVPVEKCFCNEGDCLRECCPGSNTHADIVYIG